MWTSEACAAIGGQPPRPGMHPRLTEIAAHPAGPGIAAVVRATGVVAALARYKAPPLTDLEGTLAHWRCLRVELRVDDLEEDLASRAPGYEHRMCRCRRPD